MWSWQDYPSDPYHTFQVIFTGIGSLVSGTICIYHIVTTIINVRIILAKKQPGKRHVDMHYYISIGANILGVLTVVSTFDVLVHKEKCDWLMIAGPALYVMFKMSVYLTLIGRLCVLFTGSFRRFYNKKALQVYSLTFTILNIAFTVYTYMKIKYVYSATEEDEMPFCKLIIPTPDYGVIMLSGLDIVVGTINMVLFSKPLCAMYRLHKKEYYKIVVIRACIASILAHLTTIAALVAIFFKVPVNAMITADCILSSICVIALYKWNWFCTNWMIPNWKEYKHHMSRTGKGRTLDAKGPDWVDPKERLRRMTALEEEKFKEIRGRRMEKMHSNSTVEESNLSIGSGQCETANEDGAAEGGGVEEEAAVADSESPEKVEEGGVKEEVAVTELSEKVAIEE